MPEFKPQDHKYHSVRQAASLLGVSVRTMNNRIDARRIAYLQVDTYKIICQDEIDRIMKDGIGHQPKAVLTGHKTIRQAAKALGIQPQSLKKYVKEGRLDTVKKDGVFFIPDITIALWAKVDKPNPNTVEAYYMKSLVVRDAAKAIDRSVSYTRSLINDGELHSIEGYNRKYVLKKSIDNYLAARLAVLEL